MDYNEKIYQWKNPIPLINGHKKYENIAVSTFHAKEPVYLFARVIHLQDKISAVCNGSHHNTI